jgi:ABC-type bacteriocin/lantibiotic exporter with double-glycine peptidase domain
VVVVFVVISIFFLNIKFGVIENIMSIMAIFVLAAIRIIPSLSRIISALQNYRYNLFSAKLFYDILFDKHKKNEQFIERKKIKINKSYFFKKNIIFSDVSFYYNPENIIFDNINLKINKSDQILIKGKSGIGKSTFLDLLTGLQNPKSGKILIDSKYNIIDFDKLWKLKVGYVAQKNFLLNDTILNNIIFSKNEKNVNLKKINTILENINLKKEIDELPGKLNTIIGDFGGNKLSGGQLQRIALARALYKEPEILILDEGTSALDSANEENILSYLKSLKITFINCTHKYKNINKYSQIFEIQKKKIKVRKNV